MSTISDEITSLEWDIIPKDDEEYGSVERDIERVKEFFKHPNKNNESFTQLIRAWVKDIMELDAGVMVKVFSVESYDMDNVEPKSGAPTLKPRGERQLEELYVRDGASFLKEVDKFGFCTGFWQYSYQIPAHPMWFNRDEICYAMRNQRSMSPYGYAPTQAILDIVKSLHYSTLYNKKFFEESSIPDGVLSLIGSNETETKNFVSQWNGEFRGQPHKLAMVNTEVKWTPMTVTQRELEFLETQSWYYKLVISMYGLTPVELGLTEDVNRATSQSQAELAKRKGIRPLLKMIEGFINMEIIPEFGTDAIEFSFIYDDPTEKKQNLENWQMEINLGIKTVNEVRIEMGMDEVPWGNEPKNMMINPYQNQSQPDLPKEEGKGEKKDNRQNETDEEVGEKVKKPFSDSYSTAGPVYGTKSYEEMADEMIRKDKNMKRYKITFEVEGKTKTVTGIAPNRQGAIDYVRSTEGQDIKIISTEEEENWEKAKKPDLAGDLKREIYQELADEIYRLLIMNGMSAMAAARIVQRFRMRMRTKSVNLDPNQIRNISEQNGINFEQLMLGIATETEHAGTVNFNMDTIISIALDHLKEDKEYYTKLIAMEKGKKERQEAIDEFEEMRDMAELRALSHLSLERPLTDEQAKRMLELGRKLGIKKEMRLKWICDKCSFTTNNDKEAIKHDLENPTHRTEKNPDIKKGIDDGQYYHEPQQVNQRHRGMISQPQNPKPSESPGSSPMTARTAPSENDGDLNICPNCKFPTFHQIDLTENPDKTTTYHCDNCGITVNKEEARALVEQASVNSLDMMMNTPQEIRTIPGWSPKSATKMQKSMDDEMTTKDFCGFDYTKSLQQTQDFIDSSEYRKLISKYLSDIDDEKIQMINETLREGIKANKTISEIATQINKILNDKARSNLIARTEVIRVTNEGNRQRLKEKGIDMVEWISAPEDGRLCHHEVKLKGKTYNGCAELNGKEFTITEIKGMIPAHPRCRCTFSESIKI